MTLAGAGVQGATGILERNPPSRFRPDGLAPGALGLPLSGHGGALVTGCLHRLLQESERLGCGHLGSPLRLGRLSDPWAARKLLICVRDYATLPAYVRELVDTLREPAHS